jgi:hypothetical protein
MSIFDQISLRIIKEQEMIIGPIAWQEAGKVQGLVIVDENNGKVDVTGNAAEVVDRLINQYARLFGKASTEACKDAVQDLIAELPQDQIPSSLK